MFKFIKPQSTILYAPVNGIQKDLETINDPVFSTKMMGEGVGFINKGDTVYAPCEGTISILASTNHAVGITMKNGVEILIHIGLDTVELKGKGFTPLIKQGDNVKVGSPLVLIDKEILNDSTIDLTTILIVLDDNKEVKVLNNTDVEIMETPVIKIENK